MNAYARWVSICMVLSVLLLSSPMSAAQASATTSGSSLSKPHLAGGIPVSATLDVLPSHPTVEDAITIVVGGIWSDSCVPYELATNVTEEMVLLSLITPPPDVVCGQAYTPWSLKAELGKLSTGVYLIKVQGGLTMSKTLTVSTHLIYLPTVSNERSITE